MTYARLQREMPPGEMELWRALDAVRSEECPSCGLRVDKDTLGHVDVHEVTCLFCQTKYKRIVPTKE